MFTVGGMLQALQHRDGQISNVVVLWAWRMYKPLYQMKPWWGLGEGVVLQLLKNQHS